MSETPSEPGWYPHPTKPDKFRYFNGSKWVGAARNDIPGDAVTPPRNENSRPVGSPPEAGWSLVVVGALLTAFGVLMSAQIDDDPALAYVGLGLTVLGGFCSVVGCVAAGVVIGMRRYSWERENDRL